MKKSRLKKYSQKDLPKLKRKLWAIFSKYIRERDKYICFTCGRKGEGSGIHAGHFISKQIGGMALYFNEENVHAQCYNCNINLGGNHYIYGQKLGQEKCDDLYKIKNTVISKWDIPMFLERIEYYKSKIQLT